MHGGTGYIFAMLRLNVSSLSKSLPAGSPSAVDDRAPVRSSSASHRPARPAKITPAGRDREAAERNQLAQTSCDHPVARSRGATQRPPVSTSPFHHDSKNHRACERHIAGQLVRSLVCVSPRDVTQSEAEQLQFPSPQTPDLCLKNDPEQTHARPVLATRSARLHAYQRCSYWRRFSV